MGWFDKKSWQLRGKIKDLQGELAAAEREGKFVVAQGLFFAELQQMGDATMMVLGSADTLDAEEESIVRAFFDRNGFSVEKLKLDRAHKTLAEVEIIPPEELTRHVARILKQSGFRMIDDSESERPSDLAGRIFPLSSVVRSISCLFAEFVHEMIVETDIKMNMEGNRLLHWMPVIRDALEKKIDPAILPVVREPFINGYNHFYGRYGTIDTTKVTGFKNGRMQATQLIDGLPEDEAFDVSPERSREPQSILPSQSEKIDNGHSTGVPSNLLPPGDDSTQDVRRSRDAAFTLSRMYKALVGATPARQVRNCELVLEEISRFFQSTGTCLLRPIANTDSYGIEANAGKPLCFEDCDPGQLPVSQSLIEKCVIARHVISTTQEANANPSESMVAHSIESAAAAPIFNDGELAAVIYIDRRDSRRPFTVQDHKFLEQFAGVFREFPDLLLHCTAVSPRTQTPADDVS